MNLLSSQEERKLRGRHAWGKRSIFLSVPLLCLVIFGAVIGVHLAGNVSNASAASLIPIKGHVPALVKTSTLVSSANPNQNISLAIGLQLRNADSLKIYVDNMYSKNSVSRKQLTPAEVAAGYAPLASSQQSVIDYMQGYGFHVTMTLSQHLVIGFQGTIADAENAFHIQINNYQSSSGQNFYAPSNDPAVPANLAGLIQNVIGLDNTVNFTHAPVTSEKPSTNGATASSSSCIPGPGGYSYYLPAQFAQAYNLTSFYNAGFQGEGQTIALVELNAFFPSDISAYTHCYGGGSVPIHTIAVDGGIPSPVGDVTKTETDMELILSAAPHLAALDIYQAPNNSAAYVDLWSRIINDDAASVISTGWFNCESGVSQNVFQQENTLFTIAAAQGQTILAASGDSGSVACGTGSSETNDPASQPLVTGVGGTELTIGQNNTYYAETVWNVSNQITSGGGISQQWAMPAWQQGPGVINPSYSSGIPCSNTGGYCREVPDVALNAAGLYTSSAYLAYCYDGWRTVGNTAAATSMWAVFMALTNEKALHDGGFNIGFANPYLYQIAQNSTMYANDFHDIITGTNGHYPATAGYDMASGLGSYNAWNLGQDLEKLATAQNGSRGAPANTSWYFSGGYVGGSYKEYITILNPSTTDAHLTAQYFFPNKAPLSFPHTIPANARITITVNTELGIAPTAPLQAVSAVITSDIPVGVERPMYFNVYNVASGSDVQGATSTGTTFYFAAGDSRQTSSVKSQQLISILNPGATTANIHLLYYSGGKTVEDSLVTVGAQSRGTFTPKFLGQTAIQVVSDQPIVAERSEYFNGNVPNAGGNTTGASSTMGVTTQGQDWLFAEGYTGGGFQENMVLANFATTATTATIRLEYTNGTVQTVSNVAVPALSQVIFDVNNANAHPNCGASGNPTCTVSNSVSIEVTSAGPIVAERVQYFHFGLNGHSYPGMDDVVGQPGPASQSIYSFAEGQTGTNFNDWLTLQNPNNNLVVVAVTVFADNTIVQKEITLPAHSRSSVLINDIVNPLVATYPNSAGYTVSMDVQSFGGPIVAERPLYFVFSGTTGASDIIGYTSH